MRGIIHNGVKVSVQDWNPWKKLPVLVVEFEDENKAYKCASFNSKETAEWFCDVMEEFFNGMVSYELESEEARSTRSTRL